MPSLGKGFKAAMRVGMKHLPWPADCRIFRAEGYTPMFLDKLWVRIKGDLLIMKDDLAAATSLRERAAVLLARLEELLTNKASDAQGSTQKGPHSEQSSQDKLEPGTDAAVEDAKRAALQDVRREWERLLELREERHEDSKDSDVPPPNPRKLG